MRSSQHPILCFLASIALACSASAWAKPGNGNGGGNAGGGGGGGEDPVFKATSIEPLILGNDDGVPDEIIESTSLNFNDIVFRKSWLALGDFDVDGADCGANFGDTLGTFVIGPNPELAPGYDVEARFWFTAPLNGKNTQYFLRMYGASDGIGNWFPASTNTVTFTSWELMAEKQNARRTGCYGEGSTSLRVEVSPL